MLNKYIYIYYFTHRVYERDLIIAFLSTPRHLSSCSNPLLKKQLKKLCVVYPLGSFVGSAVSLGNLKII